jgi:hypothetical protein
MTGASVFATPAQWIIYACGLVLATHTTFVTERVFAYRNPAYQQWLNTSMWPRMTGRALLFSLLLLDWNIWSALVLVGAVALYSKALSCRYRYRALLMDGGVVLLLAFTLTQAMFASQP